METKNFVPVGGTIPIQAQLHDGDETQTVVVLILDPLGKQIERLDLVAGVGGLYFTNFAKMPDLPFVTVQAHVLGVDKEGQPYAIVSERFYQAPKVAPPETVLKGRLVFSRETEKIMQGVLLETAIVK